jgi:hypothetical protein
MIKEFTILNFSSSGGKSQMVGRYYGTTRKLDVYESNEYLWKGMARSGRLFGGMYSYSLVLPSKFLLK